MFCLAHFDSAIIAFYIHFLLFIYKFSSTFFGPLTVIGAAKSINNKL